MELQTKEGSNPRALLFRDKFLRGTEALSLSCSLLLLPRGQGSLSLLAELVEPVADAGCDAVLLRQSGTLEDLSFREDPLAPGLTFLLLALGHTRGDLGVIGRERWQGSPFVQRQKAGPGIEVVAGQEQVAVGLGSLRRSLLLIKVLLELVDPLLPVLTEV